MKTNFLTLSLILILSSVIFKGFGQTQNPIWVIPNNQIKFSPSPLVSPISSPWTFAEYSYNAMPDASGNILFYCIDGYIYDGAGNLIDIFIEPSGGFVLGLPELCIVPVPESCTQYYIIGAAPTSGPPGTAPTPFYVTLDMSLPNTSTGGTTFGALLNSPATKIDPAGINYSQHGNAMHLAVSKIRQHKGDRVLFISDNSQLFRFAITSTGINQLIGVDPLLHGYNSSPYRSELELYEETNGNYLLASIEKNIAGGHPVLVLYELDPDGILLNSSFVSLPLGGQYHGVEFSPNGQFVYLTATVSPYVFESSGS
ncbi:MAG: hypothetical protein DWQ44_05900 [Bacteroidetes bacterium]|nr:MAG: hypothetical protein DWQ33_12830 [Bacteroidota bacterium]REK03447.1 MAG: hypothetical protein DWQ39_09620 [Bacteroidota bacterium]REK34441.1 MAG: hypothetical protein DWQ44_05900 [Bacteroidota bacterium]REK50441.1 MAG: hypothetical protein DWQ48_03770 [Bacteroidota bacterium]